MDEEMVVKCDGNCCTGASHVIKISNNNNNVNINDNNNNDTIIIIIIIIETAMSCRRRGQRQWHGRRLSIFKRSDTAQRDKMGTIDKEDDEVGRRAISSPNALRSQRR